MKSQCVYWPKCSLVIEKLWNSWHGPNWGNFFLKRKNFLREKRKEKWYFQKSLANECYDTHHLMMMKNQTSKRLHAKKGDKKKSSELIIRIVSLGFHIHTELILLIEFKNFFSKPFFKLSTNFFEFDYIMSPTPWTGAVPRRCLETDGPYHLLINMPDIGFHFKFK